MTTLLQERIQLTSQEIQVLADGLDGVLWETIFNTLKVLPKALQASGAF